MMRSLLPLVLLLLAACSNADDDEADAHSGDTACNPLVGGEQPITLGEVLAVGRDADGVVYVLEQPPDSGELRAFVSDGSALQRHRVPGSGSGTQDDIAFYDVGVEADPEFKLYLEIPDNGEPTFSKLVTEERNSPGAVADGEELELLGEDALANFELQNLPPEVTVEYFGELVEGDLVVVTRPSDDWTYDDFRLFLGSPAQMRELDVESVTRGRDGGSTTIETEIAGAYMTLSFPVVSTNGTFEPGPWTYETNGQEMAIERIEPAPDALDPLAFFCF
jgi:hypothetical protein